MQVSYKMKKEIVELMKASNDKDLNKSYLCIDKLPLKSFQRIVEILKKNYIK